MWSISLTVNAISVVYASIRGLPTSIASASTRPVLLLDEHPAQLIQLGPAAGDACGRTPASKPLRTCSTIPGICSTDVIESS